MGERKGRYAKTAERLGDVVLDEELEIDYLSRLLDASPLKHEVAKEALARTVVQSERQARQLLAMSVRNADEERALTQAHSAKLKALTALMLTKEEADDPEDSDDED